MSVRKPHGERPAPSAGSVPAVHCRPVATRDCLEYVGDAVTATLWNSLNNLSYASVPDVGYGRLPRRPRSLPKSSI